MPLVPDSFDHDEATLNDREALPPATRRSKTAVYDAAAPASKADLDPFLRQAGDPHALALRHVSPIVDVNFGERNDLIHDRSLFLSEANQNTHTLVVGRTGSGKTQLIWTLAEAALNDPQRTIILFEIKKEMYGPLREMALRAGRKARDIYRLDLSDPATSIGWNPVSKNLKESEAFEMAFHLVESGDHRRGADEIPFWRNVSVELISGILLALASDPSETPSLPRVREILNLPRRQFLVWLDTHRIAPALQKFAAFLRSGSQNAETCLSDAGMRMLTFLDRSLCAVMSHGELDISRIFSRPSVLVVEMGEENIERLRPIFSLLVTQLLNEALRVAGSRADAALPFPVTLVLDEFASALGRLPDFHVRLNTLRSRRVGIVAACQGLNQLRLVYGAAAETVLGAFNTKVFFPSLENEDAEYASRLSGTMTALVPTRRLDCSAEVSGGLMEMSAESLSLVARRVFLPDEIRAPRKHWALGAPATVFLPQTPPFQAYFTPAYRQPELAPLLLRGKMSKPRRRRKPLSYTPSSLPPTDEGAKRLSNGITDARGCADETVRDLLEVTKGKIEWEKTTGSARKWWLAFENENEHRLPLVLRLAEELALRKATVSEFFIAYVYSNTDSIQANLHYLDYTRLKGEQEKKKRHDREQAAKAEPEREQQPTFVTCTSCESLMPAQAVRCLTCGAKAAA